MKIIRKLNQLPCLLADFAIASTQVLGRHQCTKFVVNYGGGVKFTNLAGPIGFRLDLRGHTIPNVLVNLTGQEPTFPEPNLTFLEGTVGLIIKW